MKYSNPIIPGFHPDPSFCRVGENYYLVTSSFEYFPGVPIFHSRDLVHWRQIGHCLTRASQLPLDKAPSSSGIYAPTIRYNDGLFYMVTTNVAAGGHFYVTAKDPAGEWSEPVWFDQGGIDPSLFFDDDGKVYFTSTAPDNPQQGCIIQSEIDIKTGERLTEPRKLWTGTGGQYPEAPHLYKINDLYYLMIAEGGTDWGHMVTIARSESPWGPFLPAPRNPILTHRSTCLPIQNTGHADLIQAHDGTWWLTFLGTRPIWNWHHLGRETFLAPVQWDDDGWPLVGDNGTISILVDCEGLSPKEPDAPELRDDFDSPTLGLQWNYLRNPVLENYSLAERTGWLRLRGSAVTLDDVDSPTFVGRRQEHFDCTISARIEFEPESDHEEAGLTVLMNERHHYEIAIGLRHGEKQIFVRKRIGAIRMVEAVQGIPAGPVILQIKAREEEYAFQCVLSDGQVISLAIGETRYLSKEVAGGFTGVYFGMYATGNGRSCGVPADFDGFEYLPGEND